MEISQSTRGNVDEIDILFLNCFCDYMGIRLIVISMQENKGDTSKKAIIFLKGFYNTMADGQ